MNLRTINLNGYIDEEVFYGDEITPAMLHDALYGENGEFSDDVRIILNSYGGSCNAAVRMHDDIRAYPGRVHLVISGTAASAATVLSAAADTLEMTPGSLYMIHDPSTVAWGNERDFGEAIALLKACKESILNIYSRRSPIDRSTLAAMMTATTWMDAGAALAQGFIDGVADPQTCPMDSATMRTVNRKDAEPSRKQSAGRGAVKADNASGAGSIERHRHSRHRGHLASNLAQSESAGAVRRLFQHHYGNGLSG